MIEPIARDTGILRSSRGLVHYLDNIAFGLGQLIEEKHSDTEKIDRPILMLDAKEID